MSINHKAAIAFWLSAIAFLIAGPKAIVPAFAADPLGTWYTAEQKGQVRISTCGGALCGTLVWLKEPNDPDTGKPKTDKENADASKRSRPLIGVQIVLSMKPSGTPDQWKGEVYNSRDGNTYTGYFTLTGPDTAELKGCAMGIICKTEAWTRAK
jgi:uncharacterized protein (DUF2147 family)